MKNQIGIKVTPQEWKNLCGPDGRVLASGKDYVINIGPHTPYQIYCLDGDGHGSITVMGSGHGDAVRRGIGHGDAIRYGSGYGHAMRKGSGHGYAYRDGSGHGRAVRDGSGWGDAVRKGSGYAYRGGDGWGDAVRDGSGYAYHDGSGWGDNSHASHQTQNRGNNKVKFCVDRYPHKKTKTYKDLIEAPFKALWSHKQKGYKMKNIFPLRYVLTLIILIGAMLWYVVNVDWYQSAEGCKVMLLKHYDYGYAFCSSTSV